MSAIDLLIGLLCITFRIQILVCIAVPQAQIQDPLADTTESFHEEGELILHRLPSDTKGRCLDGTPAAYYLRTLTPPTNDWILYFEGGGWCYNKEDCYGRSFEDLGSSKSYPSSLPDLFGGLLSRDKSNYFSTFNLVYMKYCDGNSFAGDRTEPINVHGRPLYFHGKKIKEAVLHHLRETTSFKTAERIIITGCSAGGLSTYLQSDSVVDWLQEHIPSVKSVHAFPISGFFLQAPNTYGMNVFEDQMRSIYELSNARGGLNPHCIAAYSSTNEEWKCNFAEHSFAYTKVRTFVLNSSMDSYSRDCILTAMPVLQQDYDVNGNCSAVYGYEHCGMNLNYCPVSKFQPFVNYQKLFLNTILTNPAFTNATGNGGFLTSCITHCEGKKDNTWRTLRIGNVTLGEAAVDWYLSPSDTPSMRKVYQDCILSMRDLDECNPTCP